MNRDMDQADGSEAFGPTYGRGVLRKGALPEEYGMSPHLTGMSDRAKQFVPFAALTGFYEMIEAASNGNIDA